MQMRTAAIALALALLIVAGGGAWSYSRAVNEAEQLKAERNELVEKNRDLANEIRMLEQRLEQVQQTTETVTLYFVVSRPTDFVLMPEQREVDGGEGVKRAAVEQLLAGPRETENAQAVFPQDVEVIDVRVDDSVAYVNFSSGITRIGVGSDVERLAVLSIVNTLTEFDDVQMVQILVEGNRVETLAGHVDISEPLMRQEEVIMD